MSVVLDKLNIENLIEYNITSHTSVQLASTTLVAAVGYPLQLQ